jgi:hypothetical protein
MLQIALRREAKSAETTIHVRWRTLGRKFSLAVPLLAICGVSVRTNRRMVFFTPLAQAMARWWNQQNGRAAMKAERGRSALRSTSSSSACRKRLRET